MRTIKPNVKILRVILITKCRKLNAGVYKVNGDVKLTVDYTWGLGVEI
jgi:hypothetical protein